MKIYKICLKWINYQESLEDYQVLKDQLYTISLNFKNKEVQEMYHQHNKATYISQFRICTLFQIIINIILCLNSYFTYHAILITIFRAIFFSWLIVTLIWQSKSSQQNWKNQINFFLVVDSLASFSIYLFYYSWIIRNIDNLQLMSGLSLISGSMQILFALCYLLVCPSWQCQVMIVLGYFIPLMVVSKEYLNYKQFYEYLLIMLLCFVLRMKDKYTKLMFLQVHTQKQNTMACKRIFDECVTSSIIIVKTNESDKDNLSPKGLNEQTCLIEVFQPTLTNCQLLYANKFAQQYLKCSAGFNCVEQLGAIQVIQDDDKRKNLLDILKNSSWIDKILAETENFEYALGQDQKNLNCFRVISESTLLEEHNPKKQYCDVTLRSCIWEGQRSIIIVLNDTTDRVSSIEYFKDLNSYKDQLLATVSHDLKTPLNATQLLLFTIKELCENKQSLGLNEIQNLLQYINDIFQSNCMLMTMINDLLDYSQMRKGKLRLQAEIFSLDECLNAVHSIFKGQTEQKNLNLLFDKPDSKCFLTLMTDQNRLKQILINLLSNSLKFTFEGHIKLTIDHVEPYLVFQVEDTGIGMPQCVVQNLFQEYATFNLGNKNKQGIGLGLVISSKLVGLLGPEEKIYVDSVEGKGTRFTFKIYRKLVQISDDSIYEQESDSNVAQQPKITQRSLKIRGSVKQINKIKIQVMIVDDTIFNISAFKIILQKVMNCNVTEAYNGKDAVKLQHSGKKYDLIFMDISMPVMDGYQATELIREYEMDQQNKPCTIIMASAFTLEQEYLKIKKSGADGLIEKPINIKILTEILKRFKFID